MLIFNDVPEFRTFGKTLYTAGSYAGGPD